jgi:hypothetical protein
VTGQNGGDSLRYYPQEDGGTALPDGYIFGLPLIDFTQYGFVSVTISSNYGSNVGENNSNFAGEDFVKAPTVITLTYDSGSGNLEVRFDKAGAGQCTQTVADTDIISGTAAFSFWVSIPDAAAYGEIYISPITASGMSLNLPTLA